MDNTTAIMALNQTMLQATDVGVEIFSFSCGFIMVILAFHGIMKYG